MPTKLMTRTSVRLENSRLLNCEDQIDQDGSADDKRHSHAEEDRQQGKALGCLFLLLLGRFAAFWVRGADTTGVTCVDAGGFRPFVLLTTRLMFLSGLSSALRYSYANWMDGLRRIPR